MRFCSGYCDFWYGVAVQRISRYVYPHFDEFDLPRGVLDDFEAGLEQVKRRFRRTRPGEIERNRDADRYGPSLQNAGELFKVIGYGLSLIIGCTQRAGCHTSLHAI